MKFPVLSSVLNNAEQDGEIFQFLILLCLRITKSTDKGMVKW